MIAEAIRLRPGSPLKGQPVALATALGRASERARQWEIARAYWRLAGAVALCNYRQAEVERLQAVRAGGSDALALGNAQASASAALRAAEVAAIEAQHELADKAGLDPAGALPLPADPPHIGVYRTRFDELFAAQPAPGRTRLIDRTLPVRRKAIDARAAAVHAAEDALDASADAFQQGRAGLDTVLSCYRQAAEQRTALVQAVCDYNHEIAEYAAAAAPPNADGRALAAMLVLPGAGAQGTAAPTPADRRRASAGPEPDVLPAGFNELPPQEPTPAPPRSAVLQEPTPAPPRGTPGGIFPQEPTLAPRSTPLPGEAGAAGVGRAPDGGLAPRWGGFGAPPEPAADALKASLAPAGVQDPFAPPTRVVPPSGPRGSEETRTVQKPVAAAPLAPLGGASALYPGLARAAPAARAKQLTVALHWDRTPPKEAGQPVTLEHCLRTCEISSRREVIEAFWTCRQQAAACQAAAQHVELLRDLFPMAIEGRARALGAESMLRLRAARTAAEADLLDAEVGLADWRYELTLRTGARADSPWLMPSTAPHAGPYQMKLEARPKALAASWPVRRTAGIMPALYEGLKEQAAAVVEADRVRAVLTDEYQIGRRPIEDVLQAAGQQREETLSLLQTLTDYNQAIADYVFLVLPDGLPADVLVQTLVVGKQGE